MSIIDKIIQEHRSQGLLSEDQLKHLRDGLESVKEFATSDDDLHAYALGYVISVHMKDNDNN